MCLLWEWALSVHWTCQRLSLNLPSLQSVDTSFFSTNQSEQSTLLWPCQTDQHSNHQLTCPLGVLNVLPCPHHYRILSPCLLCQNVNKNYLGSHPHFLSDFFMCPLVIPPVHSQLNPRGIDSRQTKSVNSSCKPEFGIRDAAGTVS